MAAAIYQLVNVAGDLTRVAEDFWVQLGPTTLATVPEPYNLFAAEALDLIQAAISNLPS
ncbi:MAG TPA: hypothetical protein VGD69_32645 [Herpetosiphonaceae bacterium]